MTHEKSCGAVVYRIENEERLFLIEHMKKGHVSLPKGHVEGEETEVETALREIKEETGLEVGLDTTFRSVITYSPYEDCTKDVIFFVARNEGGDPVNQESEVTSLSWLPFEKAKDILTYDDDKNILTAANVYLDKRERMIAKALDDLANINRTGLKQSGKDMIKKTLGRPVQDKDPLFWPAGMLLLGLAEACGDIHTTDAQRSRIKDAVKRYLTAHASGDFAMPHIDDALAGYAALRMYERTRDDDYRGIASRMVGLVKEMPKDAEGSFIYNPSRGRDDIFADGTGMSAMLLAEYGYIHGEADTIGLAGEQISAFMKRGMEYRTGLPFHGYSLNDDVCEGIVGWGRAVGWLLMGYAALVHAGEACGVREFRKTGEVFASHILRFLREDGMFPWMLGADRGHVDTSATAMILFALKQIAPDADKDLYAGISRALFSYVTDEGVLTDSLSPCEDFAVHRQVYGHYPYGQGAVLAALSTPA